MNQLHAHLKTGTTTVCRAWDIRRSDGVVLGFTDHDRDLTFEGIDYQANAALDGAELEKKLGLSPDNGAVSGALQSTAISERDLLDGRYDDAEIRAWLVNWEVVSQREIIFAGFLGQIEISDGQFDVELRSFSDRLNLPLGRRYLMKCGTELGSVPCGVHLGDPAYSSLAIVKRVVGTTISVELSDTYVEGWFARGTAEIEGRKFRISEDKTDGSTRSLILPDIPRGALKDGDVFPIVAGCDKSTETCREKFSNLLNFQGFPFIPGEDSALATPKAGGGN